MSVLKDLCQEVTENVNKVRKTVLPFVMELQTNILIGSDDYNKI